MRFTSLILAGLACTAPLARTAADTLTLPAAALPAAGPVIATWRADPPAPGALTLEWSDAAGRLVERHQETLTEAWLEVAVPIDLRRARAPGNRVVARFQPADGSPERRAEAAFRVLPPPGWPRYQAMIWQEPSEAGLRALRALGITGTALVRPQAGGAGKIAAREAAGLRFYAENLATDFYAAYHRWRPNLPPDWLYREAKRAYAAGAPAAFQRTPSLSDPAWLRTVQLRLTDNVRQLEPHRPLYYSLGDETGIADLAAAWDFDLSPASLAAMRDWLRERHGSLDALNRAWGAHFAAWDEVTPALTDDALRREAAVPSWMEFKAWMDVAFARALRAGTEAVHRANPEALAGIEGGQVPGWGGYDYGLISSAVDLMEIYDAGTSLEIAQSLNPALRTLTVNWKGDADAVRLIWRNWLLGVRGTILWDEEGEVVRPDGTPGPRGEAVAPVLRALEGALGAQRLDMRPERGGVAVLYSQASFRLRWLLDRRASAQPWTDRDAEAENAEDAWRAATRRAAAALGALGAQPRWITSDALAAGALERDGARALVLPHGIALSDGEIAALRRFADAGGLLLADVPPGERDALGRVRPALPLADLAASGRLLFPPRLREDGGDLREIAELLDRAGTPAPLRLLRPDGSPARDVEVRFYRSGRVLLAGLLRSGVGAGEEALRLRLPGRPWVRAARGDAATGFTDELALRLDPVEPTLLVLSPEPLPAPQLAGPAAAAPGDLVPFRLSLGGPSAAEAHLVQVSVLDPAGRDVPALAEVVRLTGDGLDWHLPLALNDRPGTWRVRATDALGGGTAEAALEVR